MVKCPFCGFANEEGALFCEQCKSDVSNVAPAGPQSPPSHAPATPIPEPMPLADEVIPMAPMASPAEEPVIAALVEESPAEEEPPMVAIVEEEVVAVAIVDEPPPAPPAVEEPPPPVAEEPPPAPVAEEPPPAAVEAPVPPPPPYMPAAEPDVPAAELPAAAVAPTPAAPPAKSGAGQTPIPAGAQVKLVVQRGLKIGEEYGIFDGENFLGRADEKPVDIDLTFQEPEDRVWCSRQHALMVYDEASGNLTVEDLNSANGTFVNRERVYPGQPRQLFVGNTVQIGTVHLKVKV